LCQRTERHPMKTLPQLAAAALAAFSLTAAAGTGDIGYVDPLAKKRCVPSKDLRGPARASRR